MEKHPFAFLFLALASTGSCADPAVTTAPDPDGIAAAVRDLESADFSVREAADGRMRAWIRDHPDAAGRILAALRSLAGSEDPDLRARCAALERERANPLPGFVREAGRHPDLRAALLRLQEETTVQALREVAREGARSGPEGREIAVRVAALFLKSPDWRTRGAAAQALGLLDSPAARGFLTGILPAKEGWRGGRQDAWVLQMAMQSLSGGGPKARQAVPRLALSLDAEGVLAGAAALAMARLLGREPDDLLSRDPVGSMRDWWKAHRDDPEWKEAGFPEAVWPEGEPPALGNTMRGRYVPSAPPALVGRVPLGAPRVDGADGPGE